MRLLDKKEINVLKARERKMEVDQGAMLARKVDSLRELASKEQSGLIKFRDESLKKFKDEVSEITKQKRELLLEVESLREERKILQVPLDTEWLKVNAKEAELRDWEGELFKKDFELSKRVDEIFERIKILEKEEENIKKVQEETLNLNEEIELLRQNTLNINKEAAELKRKTENDRADVLIELEKKENELSAKLRDADNLKKSLLAKEKELSITKRQVEDQRQVLERALKRTKNG